MRQRWPRMGKPRLGGKWPKDGATVPPGQCLNIMYVSARPSSKMPEARQRHRYHVIFGQARD